MKLQTICILLSSLSFIFYAISYFVGTNMKNEFKRFNLEKLGLLVIILEILGALGLLVGIWYKPLLIFSAAGLALLMLLGVIVRFNLKDSLWITIPALFLLGNGSSLETILVGGMLFGLGFGIFDTNNMPILCQFVSPRYRATGYGIMNFVGISAGAVITEYLGKAADNGGMGRVFVLLIIVVVVSIVLQLTTLHPKTVNMIE